MLVLRGLTFMLASGYGRYFYILYFLLVLRAQPLVGHQVGCNRMNMVFRLPTAPPVGCNPYYLVGMVWKALSSQKKLG